MRKPSVIAMACVVVIAAVLLAWRHLPIEGETRFRFFAEGRAPDEIKGLLDVEGLDFISFSKISDGMKTVYMIRSGKKDGFSVASLDAGMARRNWVFGYNVHSSDDRVRRYMGRNIGDVADVIVTLDGDRVEFSYILPPFWNDPR